MGANNELLVIVIKGVSSQPCLDRRKGSLIYEKKLIYRQQPSKPRINNPLLRGFPNRQQ